MTLPSRKTLLANAASLSALVWLYGGDLRDAFRAREAEVAAYTRLPSVGVPAVVVALTACVTAVVVWGLVRRRDDTFKGYRLLPILLVVTLMGDLVRAESIGLLGSADLTSAAMAELRDAAAELATPDAVPTDPAVLGPLVERLGPAPYLARGQPVGPFALDIREGCTAPASDARGARPGTLIYCVGKDRRQAWLSAVGLPRERRFGGAPELVASQGVIHMARVEARQADGQALPQALQPPSDLDGGVAGPAVLP
jgi:hypothetical protein